MRHTPKVATALQKWAPRRSEWVSGFVRWRRSRELRPCVQLAGDEVDHRLVVACGAVPAGSSLGCLDEGIESFQQPVGHLTVMPADHAVPVLLQGLAKPDQRLPPPAPRPGG